MKSHFNSNPVHVHPTWDDKIIYATQEQIGIFHPHKKVYHVFKCNINILENECIAL